MMLTTGWRNGFIAANAAFAIPPAGSSDFVKQF